MLVRVSRRRQPPPRARADGVRSSVLPRTTPDRSRNAHECLGSAGTALLAVGTAKAARDDGRLVAQPAMRTDERLDELLLAWDESVTAGKPLTSVELCRDCPELEGDLEREIARLQT